MCEIKKPLPVEALMAILEDVETSSIFLRMDVAHTLAATRAEEACDLCIRLALDPEEHLWLREILIGDFPSWKERVSDKLLLTLMTDPIPAVCTAVMEVWCYRSSQTIRFCPICVTRGKYVRETAIKTLMAAKQRVPIEPILRGIDGARHVKRVGQGRPKLRTRRVLGDKAYSSRKIRRLR
ncbi:hypothetical protein [Dictyobacter formicarum]|uniref:HEAT repeat domain-containing protein n=1 Tax=Dictyobacter formicarum TaxID=2778368 RepID=A0ABQ3V9P7_9CHLR|nr:hypothetical protein [Dictyobacter formicarum]GHO82226.1 hypothetical protein KSZ_02320 [Dictyobacter formicarum]